MDPCRVGIEWTVKWQFWQNKVEFLFWSWVVFVNVSIMTLSHTLSNPSASRFVQSIKGIENRYIDTGEKVEIKIPKIKTRTPPTLMRWTLT